MSVEKSTVERGNKVAGQSAQKLVTIHERGYSVDGENDESVLLRTTDACTSSSSPTTDHRQLLDEYYDSELLPPANDECVFINNNKFYVEEPTPLMSTTNNKALVHKKRTVNNKSTEEPVSEPLLPKTFTEPANLSELLKNVSSSFNKKFFASRHATVSPSESLISVEAKYLHKKQTSSNDIDERGDGAISSKIYDNSDCVEESPKKINEEKVGRKNFKPVLLQGSSSFHLRQKDFSSKVNDICGQCPRCSKYGRLNSLRPTVGYFDDKQYCPCRICLILNPATSPSLQTPSFDTQELGALCQLCGQNGKFQSDGRCSRFNTTLSPDADNNETNNGLVTSASIVGAGITCREQGVQVSKWSLSSVSSCSGPLCRICHSPGDKIESLMSPCRCSGSLKYVHMSCLLRWLEISRRKLHRAPHCELCGYKYQRHKIMRFRRFQCPPCSRRDKFLHITFVLSILIMIVCACTTIICFKSDRPTKVPNDKIELTGQEIVTLVCGVMFFCAFFLAMYVQVKAQATIYKLLLRFWLMNQEWQIEEYRRDRDAEFREKYKNESSCSSV